MRRWFLDGLAGALAVAAIASPRPAHACGPEFPNRLLIQPDAILLSLPGADLDRELDRLLPRPDRSLTHVHPAYPDPDQGTAEADADDLDKALIAAGLSAEERAPRVAALKAARASWAAEDVAKVAPDEFRLYLEGARRFHAGEIGAARQSWRQLLALPPAERQWRSTWAAYMLGRSALGAGALGMTAGPAQPARAVARLRETRALAAAGFHDTLGLALESLGWEAQAERALGHVDAELRLYLEQHTLGNPGAAVSLSMRARELLGDSEALAEHAASAARRPILTAHLLSLDAYEGRAQGLRWLAALETAAREDVAGAARLAWLSYRLGEYDKAERWAALAAAADPMTRWVRGKLALRQGDLDGAAAQLSAALSALPPGRRWDLRWGGWDTFGAWGGSVVPDAKLRAELAALALTRSDLLQALELLATTEYDTDVAYLAERVLTADELKAFIDRQAPAPPQERAQQSDGRRARWLRALLARRLVREGRLTEAGPYFDPPQQAILVRYRAGLAGGSDPRLPAEDRAASLWEAAKLARSEGLDFMGTEGAPDWRMYGGNYELEPTGAVRAGAMAYLAPPGPIELYRALVHAPAPNKRWHYRYVAAELALQAADQIPDAEVGDVYLCHATRWLLHRDWGGAQRYYQAFLKRNHSRSWASSFGQSCPRAP